MYRREKGKGRASVESKRRGGLVKGQEEGKVVHRTGEGEG